ncbi:TIGR03619 family F420-dependent LLM class oxidoreductase [Actinoplanes sp. TBRC 11911]|uniref:TIGR03619 family F420-dependent LLM class oxidoreductase n=1 Tax=Actinoplanes sp. TBRC 11911 TaxID=2729386 RepID=UPI00145D76D5|nr:TIGR03619 family F420-dependent LLM class oxidoreductase [Actinoplanes sp. TBRC 11911]NMO57406.1 TIGR03619 family F420-dependent LLM class oxidoreductase [Actinoplanes sp. TBRC 11911]
MKIGFMLPHLHEQAHEVGRVAYFANEAEKAGAASLWVGDRNMAAVHPKIGAGGRGNTIPVEYNGPADPLIVLGVAASATTTAKLGTHVQIAPLYPLLQLARAWTTVDLMSHGRAIAGLGVGWSPEEYEAAGLDFATRGARLDEMLDALDIVWTKDPAEYHGTYVDLALHHSPLKPVQRPRPPIYLGGSATSALKRTGRRADGWLTLSMLPGFMNTELIMSQRQVVDEAARVAGRDPASIETVMRVNVMPGVAVPQVADAVKTMHAETGIEHFAIETMFWADKVDAALEMVHGLMPVVARG